VSEEQLFMFKVIVDMISKYLITEGLDIDFNLYGKMVTKGDEIMVRVETPDTMRDGEPENPFKVF
jgi:hypothetical protein